MNNVTHGLIFNQQSSGCRMAITANSNSDCENGMSDQRHTDGCSRPTCLQSNLFQALIQLINGADHAQYAINCIAFTDDVDPALDLAAGKSRLACRLRKTLPVETAALLLLFSAARSANTGRARRPRSVRHLPTQIVSNRYQPS